MTGINNFINELHVSRVLSISLTPELIQALKDQAKEERRSVSEVAREALKRYLDSVAHSDQTGATNRKVNARLKHD